MQEKSSFYKSATCPLFVAHCTNNFTIVGGGGGSSKSGVQNKISIYKNDELKSEFEFGSNLVIGLYQIEDSTRFFVVTLSYIFLVELDEENSCFKQISKFHLPSEPQAHCISG